MRSEYRKGYVAGLKKARRVLESLSYGDYNMGRDMEVRDFNDFRELLRALANDCDLKLVEDGEDYVKFEVENFGDIVVGEFAAEYFVSAEFLRGNTLIVSYIDPDEDDTLEYPYETFFLSRREDED